MANLVDRTAASVAHSPAPDDRSVRLGHNAPPAPSQPRRRRVLPLPDPATVPMSELFERRVAPELIRFVALSQSMGMVCVHGAWILFAIALWNHHGGAGDGVAALGARLLRAYAWLGGIGPDGRGDEGDMMLVWGKLSLVVYALDALLRALRGPRRAIALWRLALGSGAVACAGMGFALWPQGLDGEAIAVALGFGVFATGATFWGVGARRLGEALAQKLERAAPRDAARRAAAG